MVVEACLDLPAGEAQLLGGNLIRLGFFIMGEKRGDGQPGQKDRRRQQTGAGARATEKPEVETGLAGRAVFPVLGSMLLFAETSRSGWGTGHLDQRNTGNQL